ncbi:hypothetical protein [Leclercia adecarboxylata]|uniref:hypothetical protein n=1 Tax=Leclercia adecarboxylata TaxID=83655 RepID=UPI001C3F3254|nr:hypothetical protein [Leclercia adecarboxylata]
MEDVDFSTHDFLLRGDQIIRPIELPPMVGMQLSQLAGFGVSSRCSHADLRRLYCERRGEGGDEQL